MKMGQFRFNDSALPNSLEDLHEYRTYLNRLPLIRHVTHYSSMLRENELGKGNSSASDDSESGDDYLNGSPYAPRHTSAVSWSRGRSLASMRPNRYPSGEGERVEQSASPLDARRNLAMMSASPNPSSVRGDSAEALGGCAAGAPPRGAPDSLVGAPSSPPSSLVGASAKQLPASAGASAKQLPASAGERASSLRSSLDEEWSDNESGGAGGWEEQEEDGNFGPGAALSTPSPPSDSKRVESRRSAVKGGRSAAPVSSAKGETSAQKVSTTFISRAGLHEQPLTRARPVAQSRQNSRAGGKRGRVERGDDSPSPPKKSHKLEGSAKNSISVKEMRGLGLGAIYSTDGLPPSAVKNFQARFAQMGEH